MKAIPTVYDGIQFRSRLEARWAAFFTALGWKWTYEPFAGEYYIPDFVIHGERPFLVEVRPVIRVQDYEAQTSTMRINPAEWQHDLFIAGTDPLPLFEPFSWVDSSSAGLLGEHDGTGWLWEIGVWTTCASCRCATIVSDNQSFQCRPCGHSTTTPMRGWDPRALVATTWKRAIELTRWVAA